MKQGKHTQHIVLKLTTITTAEFIKSLCCSGFLRSFFFFPPYNRTIFYCEENLTPNVNGILAIFFVRDICLLLVFAWPISMFRQNPL